MPSEASACLCHPEVCIIHAWVLSETQEAVHTAASGSVVVGRKREASRQKLGVAAPIRCHLARCSPGAKWQPVLALPQAAWQALLQVPSEVSVLALHRAAWPGNSCITC